ncbi:SIR2 family protein [Nisaea nitritireducens]|uniref:SIR2 family protein n=1 Tax=Nisaea nitritireducens TaxID=568392 RepID=UPI0018688735|nr:SIR2 family protein [Nisaea nitritireducens]
MPIEVLDPANSILFLGSGFSANATSIAGSPVPAGHPLLARLAEALDEDPNDLDLKSAADEFLSRSDLSLYELLYETFTISKALDYQRNIVSLPWARIYTTNYDDIVNLVKGPNFPIFTFDEPRQRNLPPAFAVHLHGSIRKAREENAADQLILNSRSYDAIAHQFPKWFDEFKHDRRTFEACYFMGFSLSDHHITGLMTAGEESVKRTYFVTREGPKPSFVRRASDYGEIVPVGFEKFAELSKTLPKPERPQSLNALQSFKYLRPGLDSKTLADPTPVEIINLVSFGTFSQSRFFNTRSDSSYVAPRSELIEDTLEYLKDARTVLVHSKLGNGKTIFASILAAKATTKGYTCLLWRRAGRNLAQDLEVVATHNRVLVIFDDYDAAIENIERVAAGAPAARFVVTVRTGQQEVRYHEIVQRLPQAIKRVNLNSFGDSDREQLLKILRRAGAQVDDLEEVVRSAREIRDIVTQLYNHSEIREKIHDVVVAIPSSIKQILVFAALIKWTGVEMSDDYLQELAGRDIYIELRGARGIANDILDVHDDRVEMRSALLSEFLIQRIFPPNDVLDGCYQISTASTRRRTDRAHRRLAGELMKFSTLQRFLKFQAASDEALDRHFVRLSNDTAINDEPLFWLQYALFMKSSGDLPKARMFLRAGYERARKLDGFKTFQLDTQALSIYLLQEIESQSDLVEGFEEILSSIHTVTDMIADQSHRHYAIEVIGEIPAFVEIRSKALTQPEKVALVFQLNRASQLLSETSIDEKVYSGSEIIREKLQGAVVVLTR